jgi:hypothetical protein
MTPAAASAPAAPASAAGAAPPAVAPATLQIVVNTPHALPAREPRRLERWLVIRVQGEPHELIVGKSTP